MKTIYKYPVPIKDEFYLKLPRHAEILSFQVDEKTGVPCIWALIDTDDDIVERRFTIAGTGNPLWFEKIGTYTPKHIGTIQQDSFVWHLFQV